MFRRDYIVRMIEDMTAMVAKVLTLKQERKTTEALWEIDELLNRHFPLNSRLLNSLSVEDIIDMFRFNGVLESDKLQGVAKLLKEEGSIYAANGDHDAALFRSMRALHLFLYADLHGADREMLQMTEDINELLEEVKAYRLPAKTERLLLDYMESIGHYSKAEDSLYRLWEQGKMSHWKVMNCTDGCCLNHRKNWNKARFLSMKWNKDGKSGAGSQKFGGSRKPNEYPFIYYRCLCRKSIFRKPGSSMLAEASSRRGIYA